MTDSENLTKLLLHAAKQSNAPLCLQLIARGADINGHRDDHSPLTSMAFNGDVATCRTFIELGANVNLVNRVGLGPLHLAARGGHHDVCQLLLDSGAKTDHGMVSALLEAAGEGHASVCVLLIEHGASLLALDNEGRGPLHLAAWNGHTATCLALLEHGSDPQARDFDGETAYDMALEYEFKDCANVIQTFTVARAARTALQEIQLDSASKGLAP